MSSRNCSSIGLGGRFVGILLATVALAGIAIAGNTGIIRGRVSDKTTNEGLVAANIIVDGTDLGAATDLNGQYEIINVPPGRYTLTASYMSYNDMRIENVLVIQDQVVTVDFKLSETVLDVGVKVDVIAKKRDLVKRENVNIERVITDDEFKRLPVTQLSDLVGLQAGVTNNTRSGWTHIRGGRYDDVAYLVDGVAAQDMVYGTLWSSPRPTTEALQSVVVITGGFDAEYGSAMSGIIKAVTKEGGSRTTGRLRYLTDAVFPKEDLNFGYNRLTFSLGGPIVGRLRYFLSTEYFKTEDDANGRFKQVAPRGEYAADGKLTYQMPKSFPLTREGLKLTVDGHHSVYQWEPASVTYQFQREALYSNRVRSYKGNLTLNHLLDPTLFYEVKLGYFQTSLIRTVHNFAAEQADTTGFWGTLRNLGIWDRYLFRAEDWVFDNPEGLTREQAVLQLYRSYWLDDAGNKVYAHPNEQNFVQSYALIDNPYGVSGLFITEGDIRTWHYRATADYHGRVDFTKTINKVHEVRTGISVTQYDIQVYENSLPWDQNPFWDAFKFEPLVVAVYLQDKADFEDLVVRPGVRFDYLDSKARVRAFPESLGSRPEIADSLLPVSAKYRLSPRLGLSYPITERIKFRFSYGHFFKNPSFNDLYTYADKKAAELRGRGNLVVGNADMGAEKTIAYEVGFDAQLSDIFQFDLTMFYKDVFDLSGVRVVPALPQPYTMYTNVEYARIQGFEATMTKVLADYWSARMGYTFQIARGTASTAIDQYQRSEPRQIDYFLDQDQRHSLSADLTLAFPSDFGFVLMRDFDASAVFNFGSGLPYTPTDVRGNRVGEENSGRLPGSFVIDARLAKDIRFGGVGIALNCDISNVLNAELVQQVHTATGKPDFTGRIITQYEFNPGMAFGDLYYHPARDFDHDGYITRLEAYESYLRAYGDRYDPATYYGPPRKVRFGVSLSF